MRVRHKELRISRGVGSCLLDSRPACFLRGLYRDIGRIIKWLPVIRQNYDFDDVYIFIILRQKLIFMEDHFRYRGVTVGSEKVADEMVWAIKLLDRIIERDYEENALMFHDKKWGELKMDINNDGWALFNRAGWITPADKERERKEYIRWMNHAGIVRRHDMEALFAHIVRHVEKWWD